MAVSGSETGETRRVTPPLFVIESLRLCWACEGLPPGRFVSQPKNAPGFFETRDELEREVAAWEEERNGRGVEIRRRLHDDGCTDQAPTPSPGTL